MHKRAFFLSRLWHSNSRLPKTAYLVSVRRIMAITSAFQADDAGSIPAARSKSFLVKIPRNALKINTLY